MERDVENEMLEEQGISRAQLIHKNLDKYMEQVDQPNPWNDVMKGIMDKIDLQKKEAMESHSKRFDMIEKQFDKVLQKYPASAQRRRNKKGQRAINEIQEADEGEEDEDDEDDEEEEDEEEQFAQYSRTLDSVVKKKVARDRLKEENEREEGLVTEDKLRMARGDIVQ